MLPETCHELLVFAISARDAGSVKEARAAMLAVVRGAPERADAWLLLLEIDSLQTRWDAVLANVQTALRHHPRNAAVALFRPHALRHSGRRLECEVELRRQVRDYPDSWAAADMLIEISWPFDPLACVAAAEDAVARGMTGRDHLIALAADAAAVIGAFERGAALVMAMGDAAARDRATAKLAMEETAWRAHERTHAERLAAGTLAPLWELIDAGELDLARHVAARRLLDDCPSHEHELIIAMAHRLGIAGTPLLVWASFSTRRHADKPRTMLSFIDVLLSIAAFADAGAILRTMPRDSVSGEDLLRRQLFCCVCGGLDRETLVRTLVATEDAQPETIAITRAFLRNNRPADRADAVDAEDWRPDVPPAAAADVSQAIRHYLRPARLDRPRLAVCLSGQLRSFRQTWPHTRAAIARWEPVVFVSTWAGVGAGFGAHDTVERCLPPGVRARLPAELRRRSLFEAALPRTAAAMAASDEVTREEMQDFFGTEFVQVNDEAVFDRDHAGMAGLHWMNSLNQAKMFFTMSEVSKLRSGYEMQHKRMFGAVMRLRPDRAITHVGDIDVETVSTRRVLLSDYFMSGAIGDQGMLSGSEVADRLGEIWPKMLAAGSTRFFPGSRGLFNEFLIAEYMMASGVEIGKLDNTHSMGLTPIAAPVAPLWRAVIADVAAQTVPVPETESIFAAFCEIAAEEHGAGGDAALVQPVPADVRARLLPALSERARLVLDASPRG